MTLPARLVLGIDSGFDRLGLCLMAPGQARPRVADAALNSANLSRLARQLLGGSPGRICAVAVGIGPGKFSAIRTGMAFAMGLARAENARLYGISLFQMLAGGVDRPEGRLLLCSSGGGRIRYGQVGAVAGSGWEPAGPARPLDPVQTPARDPAWIDPRDLGRPLAVPAARLTAAAGLHMLDADMPDESNTLRPLYVTRPALGPAAPRPGP